jgi:dGTPase
MVNHIENNFYSDWDKETRNVRSIKENEYRTAFEMDRDRVIHSTAFRRLQGKTQVYVTGFGDQYRTRLTHSIEVAQVGRSIVNFLNRKSPYLKSNFFIDASLVEAACLAHDLGNPPIGHKGESRLNELMDEWGGFEGNAQSLRILTHIIRGGIDGQRQGGLNPTRAFLDAVLKYKIVGKTHSKNGSKFLYPDQREILDWVHPEAGITKRAQTGEKFRSIECEIMDISDDIAYTTSDLFDGYKQNLLHETNVKDFYELHESKAADYLLNEILKVLQHQQSMQRFVANLITRWLTAVSIEPNLEPAIASNRYGWIFKMNPTMEAELTLLKKMNYSLIYHSEYVENQERHAVKIIGLLFHYYRDVITGNKSVNMVTLAIEVKNMMALPASKEIEKMRLLCDFIAGMTDSFALQHYQNISNN